MEWSCFIESGAAWSPPKHALKTFGNGKLQSKWDGPYIVHSVISNGAVTIMDVKGDQFMVNGQRLKVYYEPDVVPLHHIDVFTTEEEPELLA
jgi:hypothetical protein